MTASHTPGPWQNAGKLTGGSIEVLAFTGGERVQVARVNGMAGEQEANARLIAAAPELLAALDALCDQLQGARIYLDGLIDLSAALAAIAKAEGRA